MAFGKTDLANQVTHVASFLPSQGPALGLPSPLGQQMSVQNAGAKSKKDMNTPLLLTALVDAFSILVIFLLVQVQSSSAPIDPDQNIKLPMAESVKDDKPSTAKNEVIANLVIRNGLYILDGQQMTVRALTGALKSLKKESDRSVRLVIQADQDSDFDVMTPLLASTAEAGISTLEFAVRAKL